MTVNIYDMADTWNAGGTTFTAIKMNVTDTASASASLLFDLQVGGTSKLAVDKAGSIKWGATASFPALRRTSAQLDVILADDSAFTHISALQFNTPGGSVFNDTTLYLNNDTTARIQFGSAGDPTLIRDASNVLAQRNGVNAQITRGYRTFTDASNYERWALQSGAGYFEWAAETAGTGTDDIDLRLTPAGTGMLDLRNIKISVTSSNLATLGNAIASAAPARWIGIKATGVNYVIPVWATI